MNNTIMLTSPKVIVSKINRKTKAKLFKDLKVGGIIEFCVPIKLDRKSYDAYATYITIRNIETGETTQSSFNQLPIILDAFEFENLTD